MATLDRVSRSVATKLIRKFGKRQDLELLVRVAGEYSPTTGAEVTQQRIPLEGVVWSARKGERAGVEAGDYRVMVSGAALATAPTTSERLNIDGSEYQVVDVEEIWSGDQVAAFVLSGRG